MRGKPAPSIGVSMLYGITPADAGKTAAAVKKLALCQDHPRGCGENSRPAARLRLSRGSPPRMRGKRVVFDGDASYRQDHPRGCGENARKDFPAARYKGSPPRMRGKLGYLYGREIRLRITPADAGKTAPALGSGFQSRDHPRGCGENSANCA